MQPLSGDASVLVELDFGHGGDGGRNGTGVASLWPDSVCRADLCIDH